MYLTLNHGMHEVHTPPIFYKKNLEEKTVSVLNRQASIGHVKLNTGSNCNKPADMLLKTQNTYTCDIFICGIHKDDNNH